MSKRIPLNGLLSIATGHSQKAIFAFSLMIIIVITIGCEKWDLEKEAFIEVKLLAIEPAGMDSMLIKGEINDLVDGRIDNYGFVWSTEHMEPSYFFQEGKIDLNTKTENGPFSQSLSALRPNKLYYFRAFAFIGGREYLSDSILTVQTGLATVSSDSIAYQSNRTIRLTGRMADLRNGMIAIEHGFCWSTVNTSPTPDCPDCNYLNLGSRYTDAAFTVNYKQLKDVPHYFRAYAIVRTEIGAPLETVLGKVFLFDGNLVDAWVPKTTFEGAGGRGYTSFSIGDKGYLITRHPYREDIQELWAFDPALNAWSKKSDFPGDFRSNAVGFSIGGKGYYGTGLSDYKLYNDFWEYDPDLDQWTPKPEFPGSARGEAVGFATKNKGYIGTGRTREGAMQDFFAYDPSTDSWKACQPFGGEPRYRATSFIVNDQVYVGLGESLESTHLDFWAYDPVNDSWIKKADFPAGLNLWAVGLGIGDKGYVGTGWGFSGARTDLWAYDPKDNSWTQKNNLSGAARFMAVGFSIGGKGYFGLGSSDTGARLSDFWVYDP